MQNAYDKWIGQTVILELEMGEVQTPLSGLSWENQNNRCDSELMDTGI
jgi:hypothetical protein